MKSEVIFYHCTKTPSIKVLPKLIKKAYSTNKRVLIVCNDVNEMKEVDGILWTSGNDFIPHATIKDGKPELQPVLISDEIKNLNKADILVTLKASPLQDIEAFEKNIYLFYGNDDEVTEMRAMYAQFKKQNVSTTFYKQVDENKWDSV